MSHHSRVTMCAIDGWAAANIHMHIRWHAGLPQPVYRILLSRAKPAYRFRTERRNAGCRGAAACASVVMGATWWVVQLGVESPDVEPKALAAAFQTTQALLRERKISAGHDISDGGVAVALLEMAFGGNTGIQVATPLDSPPRPHRADSLAGLGRRKVRIRAS